MHSVNSPRKKHSVWSWFVDEETQTGVKGGKHSKVKVYCLKCLDVQLQLLCERDEVADIDHNDLVRCKQCEYSATAGMNWLTRSLISIHDRVCPRGCWALSNLQ